MEKLAEVICKLNAIFIITCFLVVKFGMLVGIVYLIIIVVVIFSILAVLKGRNKNKNNTHLSTGSQKQVGICDNKKNVNKVQSSTDTIMRKRDGASKVNDKHKQNYLTTKKTSAQTDIAKTGMVTRRTKKQSEKYENNIKKWVWQYPLNLLKAACGISNVRIRQSAKTNGWVAYITSPAGEEEVYVSKAIQADPDCPESELALAKVEFEDGSEGLMLCHESEGKSNNLTKITTFADDDKEDNLRDNVALFYHKFRRSNVKIYHFTHLFNAVDILKSRKILSRNSARTQGKLKGDSAGGLVDRTSKAHNFARFYFRPKTPTQFYNECLGWDCNMKTSWGASYYDSALSMGLPKCPIPVFFEFDLKEVLLKMPDRCYYSDGNMQASRTQVYKVNEEPLCMDMTYLYRNMNEAFGDSEMREAIRHQSQQEFLVKEEFDFSNIQSLKIHCYDIFTADMLRHYFEDDTAIASKIDISSKCFHYNNRQLTFSYVNNGKILDIRSNYDGQGDAYFLVQGNVNIVNTVMIIEKTSECVKIYPEVKIMETSNPYNVYFVDERARAPKWLIYQN